MPGYVYLMANKRNGTLYLGVTSNIAKRAFDHRNRLIDGFTKEHGCTRLVWFEVCADIHAARAREHSMKKWRRAWKLALIEANNPEWRDLFDELFG